jgi:hypothetical protein
MGRDKENEVKMMKKRRRLFTLLCFYILCFLFSLSGCSRPTYIKSSGLQVSRNIRIPHRVGVLPFEVSYQFDGIETMDVLGTQIFSKGLIDIGFDVVESKHIQNNIDKLEVEYINHTALLRFEGFNREILSESVRKKLWDTLRLEGLFVGFINYAWMKKSPGLVTRGIEGTPKFPEALETGRWFTQVGVVLIHIPSGVIIWDCIVDFHPFGKWWDDSVTYTVKNALKAFRKDIDKVK